LYSNIKCRKALSAPPSTPLDGRFDKAAFIACIPSRDRNADGKKVFWEAGEVTARMKWAERERCSPRERDCQPMEKMDEPDFRSSSAAANFFPRRNRPSQNPVHDD